MATKLNPAIKAYYDRLGAIEGSGVNSESATRDAFQSLLIEWGKKKNLLFLAEQELEVRNKRKVKPDGVLVDDLQIRRGYWEAKDTHDDLEVEITKKINLGYPTQNILFEDTRKAVLFQDGQRRLVCSLQDKADLQNLLDTFVSYNPAHIAEFHRAVERFKAEIPDLAKSLTALIDQANRDNPKFKAAFANFLTLCRAALNPETTPAQVEDMLKQHILTERIFRSIFQNPDFVRRNAVAVELEKMVDALTSRSFSRDAFLAKTNHFYQAIENEARTITDYNEKQGILNMLYEQFFQAYSTRAADTHGIVYTPAPIVRWMVASVEQALQREFGLGLGSPDVHIIDPCVGTGTFVMELLRVLPGSTLQQKYLNELHANEIQLLPYYIAAQNIEHAYFERTGDYEAFPGICFADTLDLFEGSQPQLAGFAPDNTERIEAQKQAPIRVVIGNPPYNAWQESENDNNKNRKHPTIDKRISETYAKSSRATNKNALSDPYVKFFGWATERLGDRDGIICFVSNNGFLQGVAFDGFREHLLKDFTRIYHFDFKGNARTSGERRRMEGGNLFNDLIRVGIGITVLIRNSAHQKHEIFYHTVGDYWKAEKKTEYLSSFTDYTKVDWKLLAPDVRNNWLTEGMSADFDKFSAMGTKEAKAGSLADANTIFRTYSNGVKTNRDDWVYDFDKNTLIGKVRGFIDTYNSEVDRWRRAGEPKNIDDFVLYDDKKIKWSRDLKSDLKRKRYAQFDLIKVRYSLYRPFTRRYYYFDPILSQDVLLQPKIFSTPELEQENSAVCVSGIGGSKPFHCIVTNIIPCFDLLEKMQCFPFYTYAEDGTNRRENITDWALAEFQKQYKDEAISKWDIFYYVYAVLHAPWYRAKYAENLKRDLPKLPYVAGAERFHQYAAIGQALAKLHRDYSEVTSYPLKFVEKPDTRLDWRVNEKGMKLSPDRTSLRYNDWLTLENIPAQVFDYKLGNRSALEWVIDQYRVSTDARSGLRHDPNDPTNPQAIVKLIGQVIAVSLATLEQIEGLTIDD